MFKVSSLASPQRSQASTVATEPTSPSRYKIQLLSEKFSNIQTGLEKDQYQKKDALEDKLKQMEDQFQVNKPQYEARLKTAKDQALKFQDHVNKEIEENKVNSNKRDLDLNTINKNVVITLENERYVKISQDNKSMKQLDDKFTQIGYNHQRASISNNEKDQNRIIQARNQIQIITDQVDGERKQRYSMINVIIKREESSDTLQNNVQQEIYSFQTQLMVEKKVREETQKKIFSMIEDMHQQLSYDIQIEKKEREQTTEALLKLLESACLKIDQNFRT